MMVLVVRMAPRVLNVADNVLDVVVHRLHNGMTGRTRASDADRIEYRILSKDRRNMLLEIPENPDLRPVKFFAVLVDNEYTGVISFVESEDSYMIRLMDGLNQSPNINPISQEEGSTLNSYKIYNVSVNEENYGKIFWPDIQDEQAVIAGLESNPTIIPVTEEQISGIHIGWMWNGTNFVAP